MKEEKTIFKPLAGVEPHVFGFLLITNLMNGDWVRTFDQKGCFEFMIDVGYRKNTRIFFDKCIFQQLK